MRVNNLTVTPGSEGEITGSSLNRYFRNGAFADDYHRRSDEWIMKEIRIQNHASPSRPPFSDLTRDAVDKCRSLANRKGRLKQQDYQLINSVPDCLL